MGLTQWAIETTEKYAVKNYDRYPVVLVDGQGARVRDAEGNEYLDMAAGYGANNWGHNNPRVSGLIREYIGKLNTVSGNFYTVPHAQLLEVLCNLCGKQKALFSCDGVTAVEAALKLARRHGYAVKGVNQVKENMAEIISTDKNFHGRTLGAIAMSPVKKYRCQFGPFPPGLDKRVKYGDPDDLGRKITKNTVAFFVEIIAGEGGIHIPPDGYFKEVEKICRKYKVLLVVDEIQTGLGRTGYDFAYQYEKINPDILIIGKSLGGGSVPMSAVLADDNIMGLIQPGDHGSTFGAYPLGCVAGLASLAYMQEENMSQRSMEMGNYFLSRLRSVKSPYIKEVRGRGLFIGMELAGVNNQDICKLLFKENLLCLTARDNVVRFTPPLVISKEDIDGAMPKIEKVFKGFGGR